MARHSVPCRQEGYPEPAELSDSGCVCSRKARGTSLGVLLSTKLLAVKVGDLRQQADSGEVEVQRRRRCGDAAR